MSWLYSRALVEASLEVISSDGGLYAPSSATPTPQAYSWLAKTTDASRRSRSGMTCAPLTADRGEAVLTYCLEASPVKTSGRLVKAQGSQVPALVCGPKWRGSLVRLDLATSSWKTHLCSSAEVSTLFSGTWPRWGTMQSGVCSERETQAPLTSETVSGLWLTPTRTDSKPSGIKEATMMLRALSGEVIPETYRRLRSQVAALALQVGEGFGPLNPTWVEWLMGWPLGWTDLQPLATAKFQQWSASHF